MSLKGKKGFTLVEMLVVIAIIGVLAGYLSRPMIGVVQDSQIASANDTAKSIRSRTAEFLVGLDTRLNTRVTGQRSVYITVSGGDWSITGGNASDWLDGNNHWSTAVTVRGDNPANRETELLPYLASTMPDVDSAYMELHIEEGTVIGVSFIKDGARLPQICPAWRISAAVCSDMGVLRKPGYAMARFSAHRQFFLSHEINAECKRFSKVT